MGVVIDSSLLISAFSDRDKFHQVAIKILDKITESETEIYIPSLVLPEVCGGITRVTADKKEGEEAKKQIERWISSGFFTVEELTKERMINSAGFAIKFAIKGADAVFVSLAQEKGASLVSFDDKLKKKIRGKIKLFEL